MNILNKVTLKGLLKNKTRTIVTIIGIILSAAMITAVTTFISSLQNYIYEEAVYSQGDWYGSCGGATDKAIDLIKDDRAVSSVATAELLGYARADGCKNKSKPYIYLLGADQGFFEMMPVHLLGGRLPENDGEIILPTHLSTNGGVTYKIGESITLGMGSRTLEGENLSQNNPFEEDEVFTKESEKTYTVVGLYSRPDFEDYSAPGYTAITAASKNGAESYDVYFKTNNPKDISDVKARLSASDVCIATNDSLLAAMGTSINDNFNNTLYGLGSILIGLIMFGSISLIYNAFSISVSERTRQFGLLSSIGATRKQIRRSVLFEACFVSLIGIPIGILCGILGIGVTLAILGGMFSNFLSGDPNSNIALHLSVRWWAVIAAAVIGFVTVLISAYIPSKRATKVTAIEAIRGSNDIKIKNKQVKTSKITYKLFGLEGVIAKKHFKRNRKKYRATVVSLFMSVVLFISASSFCSYLNLSIEGSFGLSDIDLTYRGSNEGDVKIEYDAVYGLLNKIEGVKRSSQLKQFNGSVAGDFDNNLSKEYLAYFEQNSTPDSELEVMVGINVVDDETFKAYLKENNMDESIYFNTENPIGLGYQKLNLYNYSTKKFEGFDVFKDPPETISYRYWDQKKYEEITANQEEAPLEPPDAHSYQDIKINYVDSLPFGCDYTTSMNLTIAFAESVFRAAFPAIYNNSSYSNNLMFATDDYKTVENRMNLALIENNYPTDYLFNYASEKETMRSMVIIINVFSYGFIILISLISLANIFNTISTNINLRRKEFAMLRSVGMTNRGFNKMMNFECILYGVKSLMYGLPVSIIITYLIFKSASSGFDSGFFIPWQPIVIAVLSVFIVVFATMMYSMRKIKAQNTIDALKND